MLAQLMTETILGALTGYITNDTAIRSLFKPNGVIEQTRDDFAREAGQLLETQVLTPAVLAHQLQLPEVQKELSEALYHFLHQALPRAVTDITIQELPDSDITVQHVHVALCRMATTERDTLLQYVNKYFAWDKLWTPEQSEKACGAFAQVLLDTMQQEQFAQRLWTCWSAEKGRLTMEQLGLGTFCDTLVHNIAIASARWLPKLTQQYGAQLETAARESVRQLQLEPVLLELDDQMATMTLGQYLHCDAAQLSIALTQLLHSEQGKTMIDTVTAEVLRALETVHVPLAQLIPSDLLDDTVPILEQSLPLILTQVLDWLWDNKAAVQRMLEESVDEIATEIGGMKGMLLEQLKSTLLGELMQSSDTYQQLLTVLSGENTTDHTVDYLMYKLTGLLSDHTVGQLIAMLNTDGKLQVAVRQFVYENIERFLHRTGSDAMQGLLDWCPGSLHLAQHQEEVEDLLVRVLLMSVSRMDFSKEIDKLGSAVVTLPLEKLLAMDSDTFAHLAQRLVQKACTYAEKALPQLSSHTVYGTLYDTALWWLEHHGAQAMTQASSQIPLQQLVHTAANAVEEDTQALVDLMTQAGLTMMQGRLSILAEEQIQSLSSEEMLELVEDFMGRELQPLNYLGAGMGAAAGATVGMALSTAIPAVSLSAPLLAGGVLAGKAAVFGAVGYTTNCAAVKGLFWPYAPVAGIHTLQGVIPKQKARFAGSMGRLVDRYVINDAILHQQIETLEHTMELQHTAHTLAKDAALFARLSGELAMERQRLTVPVCHRITDYGLYKSKDALEQLGTQRLKGLADVLPDDQAASHALYVQLLSKLEAWLSDALHQEIPLDDIVSAESLWQWLAQALPQSSLPDVSGLAQELLTSNHTIAGLVGQSYPQLKHTMQYALIDALATQKTQAQITHAIGKLAGGEQLHHWLTNHSSTWVADNLTMLFHWIESTILELLHKRQDAITMAVEQEVLNRMGLMMRMGYTMMNGSAIVAAIVDRLLHQKIPIFLSVKRKELETMLYDIWQGQIAPHVDRLSAKYLAKDNTAVFHTALRTLLAEPAVQHGAVQIAMHTLDTVAHVPMASWGSYLNVQAVLARPQLQLGFQWQTHSKDLLAVWQQPICAMAEEVLHHTTLAQLSHGFQDTLPLGALFEDASIEQLMTAYMRSAAQAVSTTQVADWCHWDEFTQALHSGITAVLRDGAFQTWLQYEADVLVLALLEDPDRLLPIPMREAVITYILQGVFDTAKQHGTAILGSMQLSHLAEAQLKQMDSAHLEQVVRGFAGHYLVHIQNRGWLGAVFALPGMLLYLI